MLVKINLNFRSNLRAQRFTSYSSILLRVNLILSWNARSTLDLCSISIIFLQNGWGLKAPRNFWFDSKFFVLLRSILHCILWFSILFWKVWFTLGFFLLISWSALWRSLLILKYNFLAFIFPLCSSDLDTKFFSVNTLSSSPLSCENALGLALFINFSISKFRLNVSSIALMLIYHKSHF